LDICACLKESRRIENRKLISYIKVGDNKHKINHRCTYMSHPDASHVCVRINFHAYDDLVYRNQCHKNYYISKMAFKK
jgi:hypothetical protein